MTTIKHDGQRDGDGQATATSTRKVIPKRERSLYQPKTVQIKSRVPVDVKNAVIKRALELGENESFVVREAIRLYLGIRPKV